MDKHAAHKDHDDANDFDERKARLLRQGEFYRVGVLHAKEHLKESIRPEAIFHSVIDHATWSLRSRVDGLLKPTGVNFATLAPYALSIIGFIRKRKLGLPAIAVSAALGGIGWYLQKRRARQLA